MAVGFARFILPAPDNVVEHIPEHSPQMADLLEKMNELLQATTEIRTKICNDEIVSLVEFDAATNKISELEQNIKQLPEYALWIVEVGAIEPTDGYDPCSEPENVKISINNLNNCTKHLLRNLVKVGFDVSLQHSFVLDILSRLIVYHNKTREFLH